MQNHHAPQLDLKYRLVASHSRGPFNHYKERLGESDRVTRVGSERSLRMNSFRSDARFGRCGLHRGDLFWDVRRCDEIAGTVSFDLSRLPAKADAADETRLSH